MSFDPENYKIFLQECVSSEESFLMNIESIVKSIVEDKEKEKYVPTLESVFENLTDNSQSPIVKFLTIRLLGTCINPSTYQLNYKINTDFVTRLLRQKDLLQTFYEICSYKPDNQDDNRGSTMFKNDSMGIGATYLRYCLEFVRYLATTWETTKSKGEVVQSQFSVIYQRLQDINVKFPDKNEYFGELNKKSGKSSKPQPQASQAQPQKQTKQPQSDNITGDAYQQVDKFLHMIHENQAVNSKIKQIIEDDQMKYISIEQSLNQALGEGNDAIFEQLFAIQQFYNSLNLEIERFQKDNYSKKGYKSFRDIILQEAERNIPNFWQAPAPAPAQQAEHFQSHAQETKTPGGFDQWGFGDFNNNQNGGGDNQFGGGFNFEEQKQQEKDDEDKRIAKRLYEEQNDKMNSQFQNQNNFDSQHNQDNQFYQNQGGFDKQFGGDFKNEGNNNMGGFGFDDFGTQGNQFEDNFGTQSGKQQGFENNFGTFQEQSQKNKNDQQQGFDQWQQAPQQQQVQQQSQYQQNRKQSRDSPAFSNFQDTVKMNDFDRPPAQPQNNNDFNNNNNNFGFGDFQQQQQQQPKETIRKNSKESPSFNQAQPKAQNTYNAQAQQDRSNSYQYNLQQQQENRQGSFRESFMDFSDLSKSDISARDFPLRNTPITIKDVRGTLHSYNKEIFQVLQDYNVTQQIARRFKIANLKVKCPLIESSDFQVGVLSERIYDQNSSRYLIKCDLYFGNKKLIFKGQQHLFINKKQTIYNVEDFNIEFEGDNTSHLYIKNDKFADVIQSKKQYKIQALLSYSKTPYSLINATVQGKINGREFYFTIFLPNLLPRYVHFMGAANNMQFFRNKWRQKRDQIIKSDSFALNKRVIRTPMYFKRYFPQFQENMTLDEFIQHNKNSSHTLNYKLRGTIELDIRSIEYMLKFIVRPNFTAVIQIIPFSGYINTAKTLIDHFVFIFGQQ